MHGLGNDFLVMDTIHQAIDINQIPISLLADRHRGVGFDQLLIVTPSSKADFACRIFNADGSEAEQCGNGMRCVARYLHEEKFTQKNAFTLETRAGLINVIIHDYDHIEVMMGVPCFEPSKIPFKAEKIASQYEISIDSLKNPFSITVLSMGNPHAILCVDSLEEAPVATVGADIATHITFPKGTNVGFMQIINPKHIRLRTYERGAGETFACGSNACAAVVAGILNHGLDHKVNVELTYGNLIVEWADEKSSVILSGPATKVFKGTVF